MHLQPKTQFFFCLPNRTKHSAAFNSFSRTKLSTAAGTLLIVSRSRNSPGKKNSQSGSHVYFRNRFYDELTQFEILRRCERELKVAWLCASFLEETTEKEFVE